MSDIVIKVENLGKEYRLGTVGAGTIRDDIIRRWALFRGKKDPFLEVGEVNNREKKGEGDYVWALRDINFDVKRGEVLGIIGKNGAGKSTLLKILSKVTGPTIGTVKLKGRIASLLEVGTGFHPELSGRENIFLNGAILGMTKREIKSKFDEIVAFSGVERYIDTPVKRYSSGMYVRLAFAVAAHLESEILIIDEVLAVGDAEFQKKCLGRMEAASKAEGRTVLFVSHNMGVIATICSRVISLDKGQVVMDGMTENVIASYFDPEEKTLTKVIQDSKRVRGNKQVCIIECSISNDLGLKKNFFLIGEEIRLDFLLDSKVRDDIGFWLIIRDKEGKTILCSHQKDLSKLTIEEGRHLLSYQTKGISLLPGNYFVTAGILNESYTTHFEWIENCQSFEILPTFTSGKKFDGRLGYVMQSATWNLKRDE